MKRSQTNRYNMYRKVVDVLENNRSTWENKKAMLESVNNFESNLKTIEEVDARLLQSTKGATMGKNQLKVHILNTAFIFAAEASALASKLNDYELMEKCRLKKSLAVNYSDAEAKDFANMILSNIEPRMSQLADYNITDSDVSAYKAELEEFSKSISNKNIVKSDYSSDISNMANLFITNTRILNKEILLMMKSYKKSHPLFYEAFQKARRINDLGGTTKKAVTTEGTAGDTPAVN